MRFAVRQAAKTANHNHRSSDYTSSKDRRGKGKPVGAQNIGFLVMLEARNFEIDDSY
jgi:hypothetical protein